MKPHTLSTTVEQQKDEELAHSLFSFQQVMEFLPLAAVSQLAVAELEFVTEVCQLLLQLGWAVWQISGRRADQGSGEDSDADNDAQERDSKKSRSHHPQNQTQSLRENKEIKKRKEKRWRERDRRRRKTNKEIHRRKRRLRMKERRTKNNNGNDAYRREIA